MNNSNKTLLQILVETLPKVGGWPEGVAAMAQDADGAVQNYRDTKDIIIDGEYARGTSRISYSYSIGFDEVAAASDRLTAIITRDQYEAALAASKELRHYQVSTEHYTADVSAGKTANATGANGWIDWHGGECPVDSDAIVEVKYRKPSPLHINNDRAEYFAWSHDGYSGDIIAYRLVQQHEVKTAGKDKVTKKFTEPKAPKAPKAKPEAIQPPFGKDKLTRLADLAVHIELVHSDERLEDAEDDESMTLRAPAGVVREFMALVADYVGGVTE